MSRYNRFKKRWSLTISLVFFVFWVLLATLFLSGFIIVLLHKTGILLLPEFSGTGNAGRGPYGFLFSLFGLCVLLGIALTFFFSKKALNPIRKVIDAIHKIAEGNFSVQVELKGIGELEELAQSFNKMAHELSSIETLRSDFINNFSHEFKTPIVSVRGFAKLLRDGNLSEEERREYLDIIIVESERLALLSTNVLNLSRYENIEIITDKAPFRLDEQIRRAIVLTEPKWSQKAISMNVEMAEVTFMGNEDLMQQIWLNLLDNAIKFSYQGGMISVGLVNENGGVRFTIQDDGPGMDEETVERIFDKFYQGDLSHFKTGNGLGLAIVKRITALCGGTIEVQSELGKGSLFTVFLPNESENKA